MITGKQASKTDRVRSGNPRASAHQIVASIGGNAHRIEGSADNDIPGHDAAGTRWNARSGGPALPERHAIRIRLANRFRSVQSNEMVRSGPPYATYPNRRRSSWRSSPLRPLLPAAQRGERR